MTCWSLKKRKMATAIAPPRNPHAPGMPDLRVTTIPKTADGISPNPLESASVTSLLDSANTKYGHTPKR